MRIDNNMLIQTVIAICISLALSTSTYARLYESPAEAKARYGAPVRDGAIMLPLLKGTKELRYHHNGWRIRSAFINDKTSIISYMKLATQSTPEAVLQENEIQALLSAESDSYGWVEVVKGTKLTKSEKYQGYFNGSSRVWQRRDGSVAWVSLFRVLDIISKEGLAFDIQTQNQKKEQRKQSIKAF